VSPTAFVERCHTLGITLYRRGDAILPSEPPPPRIAAILTEFRHLILPLLDEQPELPESEKTDPASHHYTGLPPVVLWSQRTDLDGRPIWRVEVRVGDLGSQFGQDFNPHAALNNLTGRAIACSPDLRPGADQLLAACRWVAATERERLCKKT